MRVDRRLVGFGLFLVTVGLVVIAVRQGWLSDETAGRAWSLWPLLLIGAGLSILLAGRPGAAIGGLVVALTFGAIVGGVLATGSVVPFGVCGGDRNGGIPFSTTGVLDGTSRVTVSQDCGDLTISTVAGSGWSLTGASDDGRAPRVDASPGTLRISGRDDGPFTFGGTARWDVVLPRDPVIDLSIEANAGSAKVGLSGANLARLSVERNAGSIDLDLRNVTAIGSLSVDINAGSATIRLPARDLGGSLSVNAGSAALCLPPGAGLRVALGDSVAASNDFAAHGLSQVNGAWETPGYVAATVHLELKGDVNAGSLALDPTGPCAG